jgi:hypothetical protein
VRTRRGRQLTLLATGVWVLAAGLALASCNGSSAPRDTGRTAATRAATNTPDLAPPPAAQGLEPCPGSPDHQFSLRLGGDRVTGLGRGSGHRLAILTHQSRGTPCDLAALGARLADDGYRVVAWTSQHSSSTRTLRLLVERERQAGATYVALVGASLGAATSITAGSSAHPPVDAVVALSPSSQSDRSGDVARAATRFRGPLMVVAAEHDPSFADLPPELARLHDGPEEVEVVTGSSAHGKEFVLRRTDPMIDRVLAFLAGSGR